MGSSGANAMMETSKKDFMIVKLRGVALAESLATVAITELDGSKAHSSHMVIPIRSILIQPSVSKDGMLMARELAHFIKPSHSI